MRKKKNVWNFACIRGLRLLKCLLEKGFHGLASDKLDS